ncbi:aminoglycoside phosphotransferase family protein [Allorhizocola rhizosphaerae]|uniref:aminoglycoside phosphotransferase family protein n=1 Tax=Allorhizocola rhizosphaerae TaxID=1872709 RepID=UPI000E3C1FD6|nr:aminoglycoside phosphotransferase family protein [Allorhizocola rhizosphaerae]
MIEVPAELIAYQVKFRGDEGRVWTAALPALAENWLQQWELRVAGSVRHGMVALVLPVVTREGVPAALKLQQVDEEHYGEGLALRAWDGDGSVRVHREAPEALLLERLDADSPLSTVPSTMQAVQIIAELLARLHAHDAPPGIQKLGDVVRGMLSSVPEAMHTMPSVAAQLREWAAIVREVATEPGDRLLHWDLHFDNVLAGEREPWLAIDPKPLCGDPGFDLLPAILNRWDASEILPRFDLMTDVLGLERDRAAAWSLARVLQNALWDIKDGEPRLDPDQIGIADVLTGRYLQRSR